MKKLINFFLFFLLVCFFGKITYAQGCSFTPIILSNECGSAVLSASGCSDCNFYFWSTNEYTKNITVTESGEYTVLVSNGDCTSVASVSVEVESPCNEGEDLCSIEIISSQHCNKTQLQVEVEYPENYSYQWSTGETSRFIDVTQIGTYGVTATHVSGVCWSETEKFVQVKTGPVVEIAGETKVCHEGTTTITASSGESCSYQWNTGETEPTINVGVGFYSVTVNDVNGCTSSASMEVTEFPTLPAPMVTPSIDVDEKVTLTSSIPSGNIWSNGETAQSITPDSLDLYSLRVRDSNGCLSVSSCEFPAGNFETTILECELSASFMDEVFFKDVTFTNTSSGEPTEVLWFFGDNETSTEMNPVHEYQEDGTYEVTLFVFKDEFMEQVTGSVFINTSDCINSTNGANSAACDSTGITTSNNIKFGDSVPEYEFSSQTKLIAPPFSSNWKWNGSSSYSGWKLASARVGGHHYLLECTIDGVQRCFVFEYTITDGRNTTSVETRSSATDSDIKIYPNPTYGPVNIDLSGLPSKVYFLSITDQSGRVLTKKVIKQ